MAPPLSVTTPLGPDALLLVGLSGQEGLSRLFSFQLDLVALNSQPVPFDQVLGQPFLISVGFPGSGQRYIGGICSRFSEGRQGNTFTSYQAEVVPWPWLRTKRRRSRVFQDMTVPEILQRALVGGSFTYQLVGTYNRRDYVVQYRESDFDFASRLMEEEGIYYFFRHTAGGHRLIVSDTPVANPVVPGPDPVLFTALEPSKPGTRHVFDWEKVQELASSSVTLRDHHFQLPGETLEAKASIQESVEVGDVTHKLLLPANQGLEIYDYPGEYAKRYDGVGPTGTDQPGELQKIMPDANRTARTRIQEEAAASLIVNGQSNCRHFTCGHTFSLQNHRTSDGKYLLTHVTHRATVEGDPRTADQEDLTYSNTFACIPIGLPFRPPRTTPRPVISGVQSAVVVGPAGEEDFSDKYGRVKVQFHWDREGKKDENSSCWVRVAGLHAGQEDPGIRFWPRIGQEVIVGFEEGDPDQPIIVGSVWNAADPPPAGEPPAG